MNVYNETSLFLLVLLKLHNVNFELVVVRIHRKDAISGNIS